MLFNNINDICPNLQNITLHTNGILFTEFNWNRIHPETKKLINKVIVSIDASSPETYNMVRGGNFITLCKNLEFIQSLNIKDFGSYFTVNKYNYTEMNEFVDFADSYKMNFISFWLMKDWGRGYSSKQLLDFNIDKFNQHVLKLTEKRQIMNHIKIQISLT